MSDLRLALRTLLKNPGFSVVVVLTLALGIGANTAIFSFVQAVLLRTLPVTAPDELFFVAHGPADRLTSTSANYPYFERMRARTDVFAGATVYSSEQFKVSTSESVEIVSGAFASGNYHRLLGVRMALGRGFASDDDRAGAGAAIAVISDTYWTRTLGGDPNVLGRRLVVQGIPVSIVGVTAPGFGGLDAGQRADVTLPLALKTLEQADYLTDHESLRSAPIVVRLRPAVSEEQARVAAHAVFEQFSREPENLWLAKLRNGQPRVAGLLPAAQGSDSVRQRYGAALGVLMAIVGSVLLIGCANVANLLLARTAARSREMAVRMSIGASRTRLVRQLLTEGLVLAGVGGATGFALAWWGTRTITSIFAMGEYPTVVEAKPDTVVLAFTAAISMLTGLLFSLAPASAGTRVALMSTLKDAGATLAGGSRRWSGGRLLVCGQIGLCMVLVAGAGLFIGTLRNLESREVGFDRSHVQMFTLDIGGTPVSADRLPALCTEVIERLRARSAATTAASCSTSVPVRGSGSVRRLTVPGLPPGTDPRGDAFVNAVTPDYFRTFGLTVLRGRTLSEHDTATATKAVVVNERLARQYFGASDPVGRTILIAGPHPKTIVGVVRDTLQFDGLREDAPRMVFTPLAQAENEDPQLTVAIRTTEPPAALTASIRGIVRSVNRDVVVNYVRTMDDQIAAGLVRERLLATLSSWFGVLALLLAAVGLGGVMAYDVGRRRREIGIRLAIGAAPGTVLRSVLREASVVAVAGVALGLAASLMATRALSTLLFGLSPRDPFVLAVACSSLLLTALLAAALPARRAARIDPMTSLRTE